jgi:hypothetical protein
MLTQVKDKIKATFLEIQPYLEPDLLAGAAASLVIFYVMIVMLFSLA